MPLSTRATVSVVNDERVVMLCLFRAPSQPGQVVYFSIKHSFNNIYDFCGPEITMYFQAGVRFPCFMFLNLDTICFIFSWRSS